MNYNFMPQLTDAWMPCGNTTMTSDSHLGLTSCGKASSTGDFTFIRFIMSHDYQVGLQMLEIF